MNKKVPTSYIYEEPKPEDYNFGSNLPKEILREDGNWKLYLVDKELQNRGFEPFACVSYATLNAAEMLIKRQYGIETNWSDRFLAKMTGTEEKGGNSPHTVAEFLRKIGVVPEEVWPYDSKNYYATIPQDVYELAEEFNNEWDFRHEWVACTEEALSEALKSSPILIAIYAWASKNGRYYKPKGAIENHATLLVNEKKGQYREVFDTYDPVLKKLEWEMLPLQAKRFWIKKRTEVKDTQISILKTLIGLYEQVISLLIREKN